MKKINIFFATVLSAALFLGNVATAAEKEATHKRQPSSKGANVYILKPNDGETVPRKFKVVFGLEGMGIAPAGITVGGQPIPDTGHHHLLIDVEKMPSFDVPLPSDQPNKVKHFGGGQTETLLELPPGEHTLQLVFADYAHVPHEPAVVSKKITIKVAE